MTYTEFASILIKDGLVCSKCNQKLVVIDEPFFMKSKVFECKCCGYKKEISLEECDSLIQQSVEITKSAIAGDFVYTNQVEELVKDVLNK